MKRIFIIAICALALAGGATKASAHPPQSCSGAIEFYIDPYWGPWPDWYVGWACYDVVTKEQVTFTPWFPYG